MKSSRVVVTIPVETKTGEVDIECVCLVSPGDPGCRYMRNGDPGWPPTGPEVEVIQAFALYAYDKKRGKYRNRRPIDFDTLNEGRPKQELFSKVEDAAIEAAEDAEYEARAFHCECLDQREDAER